jgi:membrane dipeptidase
MERRAPSASPLLYDGKDRSMSTLPKAGGLPRVIDGHNDTLLALHLPERGRRRGFFQRSAIGHVDLPRAQEGGLGAAFFAIFVPNREEESLAPDLDSFGEGTSWPLPKPLHRTYALNATLAMASLLFRLEAASNGAFRVVRSSADLGEVLAGSTVGAILHLEGAECIDANFEVLDVLAQAGLRSVGPVWSRQTIFAHGVPFAFPSSPDIGPGLTDLGRELVRRCNGHRILIDLSHLNERGFWDVAELSNAPLVATHSGAHALCPSSRNLTDAQIKAIAQSGGMVGINFFPAFLRRDGSTQGRTSLMEIVHHVAYVAELVGDQYVGFGSDMDGTIMPDDFPDVTALPKLLAALKKAGFDDAAIERIAQGNWRRVLETTWGR